MKIKVVVLDVEMPRAAKKWALRIGLPIAVLLGGGAIAWAATLHTWNPGDTLQAADLNGNFAQLQSEIAALVPPGTVVAYAGPVAPAGWLLCDGSAQSRSQYGALFAAIGTSSGSGDGASTFNLPDYRGMFLRGVDKGDPNNRDPDSSSRAAAASGGNTGALVGSVEAAAFAGHSHSITDQQHTHGPGGTGGSTPGFVTGSASCTGLYIAGSSPGYALCPTTAAAYTGITATNSTGGTETRPVNANVNYLIKY